MAKTIEFTYKGKDYTLEYNRSTIKAMERGGFDLNDLVKKPVTVVESLVYGAFQMHHSSVSRDKAMEIYDSLNCRSKLVAALIDCYNYVLETLSGSESDEADEGNVNWSAN